MGKRSRTKQARTFEDRLQAIAKGSREAAVRLPPGDEREELLRKTRLAETTAHLDDWVSSPELQPPK